MTTKTPENEQWGRTSPDGLATNPDLLVNQGREPMVDLHGRVVVRLADDLGFITNPSLGTNSLPLPFSVNGAANVISGPGRLFNLVVSGIDAALHWIMVFDKVAAPINGDSPVFAQPILAVNGFSELNFGPYGLRFGLGIGTAISSTFPLLTITATPANFIVAGDVL